ncbi:MAG: hypothetical protein RLZZ338_3536 [Cyanobacteriota bacterium]|jgi:class 3 adenylate cyclase
MDEWLIKAWKAFKQFVYQRIILALTILFCIGVGIAMQNMSHLSDKMIETQALQNASLYAQAIKEARTFYSSDIVTRIKDLDEITVTHDYSMKSGGIPLPATFLIELGQRISETHPDLSVRLYSDYPFPWRRQEGGAKDEFEREALRYLKENPQGQFYRKETREGTTTFRYTEADLMKPSCISCHNTHPDSPKTDWKVGDVRGILEIRQPLNKITEATRLGLEKLFFLLVVIAVTGVLGLTLAIGGLRRNARYLEMRVKARTSQLQQSNEALQEAQEKSDRLLLNILPEPIAQKLKDGQKNIADGFAEVTILFADIVGFTEMSAQIMPEDLVKFLNEIFSAFDELTERYGLEKIKTIGDAYMVVGGLPIPNKDHAESIAEIALKMQEEVANFNARHSTAISIRIGINTGPVIAGVIGTKKFIYDLWGDAVNTASRMESHGIPGAIQVTKSTYERLKDKYTFSERGNIYIKGKGEMFTYLLTGRLASLLIV